MKFKCLFFLVLVGVVSLQSQTLKLASLLPESSEWNKIFKQVAAEWNDLSNGKVRLHIYPGGVVGDEADMLRKMRLGVLDIGIFSAWGLRAVVPQTFVMSLPGLLRSEKELDHIMDKYIGKFEEDFRVAGFELLSFSKGGWAYLYGDKPFFHPDDLRTEIIPVGNVEGETGASFKSLGFQVVPISYNDTMMALHSGRLTAFYAPPFMSAAFQWFSMAPVMTDYPLAPIFGGILITKKAWNKIPENFKKRIGDSLQGTTDSFQRESRRLNNLALNVMKENGLSLISLNEEQKEEWTKTLLEGHQVMVGEGKSIPSQLYANIVSELNQLRE